MAGVSKSVFILAILIFFQTAGAIVCKETLRTSAPPVRQESFSYLDGERSSFFITQVDNVLWARTIFGEANLAKDASGNDRLKGKLATEFNNNTFSVDLDGRKISYFDYANGNIQDERSAANKIVVPAQGGMQFEFRYKVGLRRSVELWVTGLSGQPSEIKILSARSGVEFVL